MTDWIGLMSPTLQKLSSDQANLQEPPAESDAGPTTCNPMPAKWSFNWITDWRIVWSKEFLSRWKRLRRISFQNNVFFNPNLCRAWLDFHGGEQAYHPRFIVGMTEAGSEALFPFICRRTGLKEGCLKMVVPVGEDFFDFHDPLVSLNCESKEAGYQHLFQSLHGWLSGSGDKNWDRLVLPRVRGVDLPEVFLPETEISPVRRLGEFQDYDAFIQSRKKKHRYDLRKSLSRLQEQGEVRLEICQPGQERQGREWIQELKVARDLKYGESPVTTEYLQSVLDSDVDGGFVHLSRLTLNGRGIAWHFGFVDESTLYWQIPSYDEEYASFSPGKLHVAMCIEWCFEQGIQAIDFLRGDEPYKTQWAEENQVLRGMDLNHPSLASGLRRLVAGLGHVLSRLKS